MPLATVPRLWPDATVVCLATGPSLTVTDVDFCRDKARVIAISNSYQRALWADVLYSCDSKWWYWHKGAQDFPGLKFTLDKRAARFPGVQVLTHTGLRGLETENRSGLRGGHNSGHQAMNLAVHFGARRLVLLGYDMQGDHYFGSHPDRTRPPFPLCLKTFETLVEPLAAAGVDVVNCTRQTALTCFPRQPLEEIVW